MKYCSCGSRKSYPECCGSFITAKKLPATPEELMRSRYTAYAQGNIDYIARTMKPPASTNFDPKAAKTRAKHMKWLKLEVLATSIEGPQGFVEFCAYYSYHNQRHVMHEKSEFRQENGQWYYVQGEIKGGCC